MEADDFFANLSSDVVTDAISASTPTKRGESSAEKAESEQTIARGDPATEVPKLEYSEWFHEESKDKLQQNTGNSAKRIVQTQLYHSTHLYYAQRYEEALDSYLKLFQLCDGNLKKDAEDGILRCYCKLGRWSDAVSLAEKMAKQMPRIAPMWLQYGKVVMEAGGTDVIPAIKAFQHALLLSSQLLPAYVGLGKAYHRLGVAKFGSYAKRCFAAALVLLGASEATTKGVYDQAPLRTELERFLEELRDLADVPFPLPQLSPADDAIAQFEKEWFSVPLSQMLERLQVSKSSGGRVGSGGDDDLEEEDRDPSTM